MEVDGQGVVPEWDGSFTSNADAQRRRWAEETSPEERLAWLEEAIRFAHGVGALPRKHHDEPETDPSVRQ